MTPQTRNRLSAFALLVAPGLLLAAHLLQPTPPQHDTASELATIAAYTARADASAAVGFVGLLLYLPGILGLARPLLQRGSRLAAVSVAMTLTGLLSLVALMGSSPVTTAMVASDADRAQMILLTDRYESAPVVAVWVGLMILGWSLGLVLLGVALWRAGWTVAIPLALGAGLVLMIADAGRWPLAAGFACTWLGMAIASHRLLAGDPMPAGEGDPADATAPSTPRYSS